jgi:hypothetical protein
VPSHVPPGFDPQHWAKLPRGQGYRDPDRLVWRLDRLHKDHWDVSDEGGRKVKEIDLNGRQIWPGGPKNKGKS